MAVTIDLGEAEDLHPSNKLDVGRRLAAWALGDVYGRAIATSGPLYADHEVRGRQVVVRFEHADGGLVARGGRLLGFELADRTLAWQRAEASVSAERVLVESELVDEPCAVRYAWAPNPECTLCNGAGLPAAPFTSLEPKARTFADGRIPSEGWMLVFGSEEAW
jgi:sialate O-acetylesterase